MTAADIFEREGITSLPLDPSELARKSGVRLVRYSTYVEKTGDTELLCSDGVLLASAVPPIIVYNEKISSVGRQRWTLIHELCHYWLGHDMSDKKTEQEVERLTSALISPAVVLHLCGVRNANDVAAICGISAEAARIRFDEVERKRRAMTFMHTDEDIRIAKQFLPFISDTVSRIASNESHKRRTMRADIFRQEGY
ncbi:MAG: ImmA/IrrE family metallo-endopeptidase [Oscillospiraceae bacterium]|nr:ImmA/IrrE family metallo-endopeptidase [Oscillospiraceae bacterium]